MKIDDAIEISSRKLPENASLNIEVHKEGWEVYTTVLLEKGGEVSFRGNEYENLSADILRATERAVDYCKDI